MPNRIDRNARSLDRLRRNMQRLSQGAIVSTIPVTAPITAGSTVGLAVSTGTGLVVTGGKLAISTIAESQVVGLTADLAAKLPASTAISTTAPLSGGGNLSTGLTISIPKATSTANGYLSSTDWTTFNNKGSGGSTSLIAADASVIVGSSSGSTTVKVQEYSTGGLSTLAGGVSILLASTSGLTLNGAGATGPAAVALLNSTNTFTVSQKITDNVIGPVSWTIKNYDIFGDFDVHNAAYLIDTNNQDTGGFVQGGIAGGSGTTLGMGTGVMEIGTSSLADVFFGSNGTLAFSISSGGSVRFAKPVAISQLQTQPVNGSLFPTIAAGSGAGTSPSVSLDANAKDVAGQITVTAGTSPATSATICTVSLRGSYVSAPYIFLTPANPAAAALTAAAVSPDSTTTTFLLKSNSTALTAGVTYKWNYLVIDAF